MLSEKQIIDYNILKNSKHDLRPQTQENQFGTQNNTSKFEKIVVSPVRKKITKVGPANRTQNLKKEISLDPQTVEYLR